MALQLKRSRSLVSMKTGGALLAIFAFLIQSIVALDLPVAFASTPVSTASVTADKDNEYRSAAVDGSKFLDLTFSFDYDARSLDATSNQDSFSYGWTVGGVDHPLGTVEGTQGNNPSEVDSISKPLQVVRT